MDVPRCKANCCRPGICAGDAEVHRHPGFASATQILEKLQPTEVWESGYSLYLAKNPQILHEPSINEQRFPLFFQTQKKCGLLIE